MNGESHMFNQNFQYDAVVILSMSDWYNEMRSNRYHYATRFAQVVPTYFVQNFNGHKSDFLVGEENGISIINPIYGYSFETIAEIVRLVKARNGNKILFWMYSPFYIEALRHLNIEFSAVFHATEAYIDSDMVVQQIKPEQQIFIDLVIKAINFSSFTISVSEGITKALKENNRISTPVFTITNGCDFKFWDGLSIKFNERENAVLYQGGIHRKIDFNLVHYLVEKNPDINFWFCGEAYFDSHSDDLKIWKLILKKNNVTYYGKISVEEVRLLSHKAKIGIIPFKKNDWLTNKSFPLKAFEYLSSGLRVLTTPIDALIDFSNYFSFANSSELFNEELRKLLGKTKQTKQIKQIKHNIKL
jgi:hypothetical protein